MRYRNPKIGLLPLYLELYDNTVPEVRDELSLFLGEVCSLYTQQNIDVVKGDICRLSHEFEKAIKQFEQAGVDCIVTLHLAYSPSLECIDALSNTKLPIIVLDTTRDKKFDAMSLLMYDHGIHGVQDMCNLLLQRKKIFFIESGHIALSDVLERTIKHILGAYIAREFKNSRVGRIGCSFEGMGDFRVSPELLESKYGVKVIEKSPISVGDSFLALQRSLEISGELDNDTKEYDTSYLNKEIHHRSVIIGNVLKSWIEEDGLSSFTINFKDITEESGIPMMPFFEICKLMKSDRVGYAGEGDVLTAALTGAIAKVFKECSFAEMFCPDWESNVIFLSHMGEINFEVIENKAVLFEKEWLYADLGPTIIPSACFKRGEAVLVNIAPKGGDTFSLILSPVHMLGEMYADSFKEGIRGWMKTAMPISDFLEKYSEVGGTHHIAIVYGQHLEALKTFGKIMSWDTIEL